jgi:ubiquinone/menaquinone biosynthesis C-methylase UbiE
MTVFAEKIRKIEEVNTHLMELNEAIRLIRGGIDDKTKHQRWADLGSGEGLFSRALASLLPGGSEVVAVDNDARALNKIPDEISKVKLHKIAADFITRDFTLDALDGVLMANSLHFVKDKSALLLKLKQKMENPRFIIIEYERDDSNPWIPYPLNYDGLFGLATSVGFQQVIKLATAPSQYHPGGIYSALVM